MENIHIASWFRGTGRHFLTRVVVSLMVMASLVPSAQAKNLYRTSFATNSWPLPEWHEVENAVIRDGELVIGDQQYGTPSRCSLQFRASKSQTPVLLNFTLDTVDRLGHGRFYVKFGQAGIAGGYSLILTANPGYYGTAGSHGYGSSGYYDSASNLGADGKALPVDQKAKISIHFDPDLGVVLTVNGEDVLRNSAIRGIRMFDTISFELENSNGLLSIDDLIITEETENVEIQADTASLVNSAKQFTAIDSNAVVSSILVGAEQFDYSQSSNVVTDSQALSGKAMLISTPLNQEFPNGQVGVTLLRSVTPKVKAGDYRVVLRARYNITGNDIGKAEGSAFEARIVNAATGEFRSTGMQHIYRDDREYQEYELGIVEKKEDQDWTISITANPHVWKETNNGVDLYLDSIAFIPTESPRLEAHPRWKNALKPKGKPGPTLTLAKDGKANYRIELPQHADSKEQKAANDLAQWLGEISGAKFIIIHEEDGKFDEGKVISIGKTQRWKEHGIGEASLSRDGYGIYAKDDALYIVGGPRRGIINGVYAFLEEDLGCRWYHPHVYPLIPRITELTVAPVARSFVPPFENYRNCLSPEANNNVGWSLFNRDFVMTGAVPDKWGGDLTFFPFHYHTYSWYMPKEQFAAHPDYFMTGSDGNRFSTQLCPSHPEVRKIVLDKTRAGLLNKSNVELVVISPNDGGGYCQCDQCQSIIDVNGGAEVAPLLDLINELAEDLGDEYPEVMFIGASPYLELVAPPTQMDMHPQVGFSIATDKHGWGYSDLLITETSVQYPLMKRWLDRYPGRCLYVWEYPNGYNSMSLNVNLKVVASNLQLYAKSGVKGVFFNFASEFDRVGGDQYYLLTWIYTKLAWDPSLDVEELIWDFNYGFYGEAAPAMQEFDELRLEAWEDWHRENVKGVWDTMVKQKQGIRGEAFGFPEVKGKLLARGYTLVKRALKMAEGNAEIKCRLIHASLPFLYWELEKGPSDPKLFEQLIDGFQAVGKRAKLSAVHLVRSEGVSDFPRVISDYRAWIAPKADLDGLELNSKWKFAVDPFNVGIKEHWFAPGFSDFPWATIDASVGDWTSQGFPKYSGFAWYRQKFTLPEQMFAVGKLWLFIGQADEESEVFINGKPAFTHNVKSTGMTTDQLWDQPYVFDATPFLQAGENTIAIQVHSVRNAGGIFSPVWIVTQNEEPDPSRLKEQTRLLWKFNRQ